MRLTGFIYSVLCVLLFCSPVGAQEIDWADTMVSGESLWHDSLRIVTQEEDIWVEEGIQLTQWRGDDINSGKEFILNLEKPGRYFVNITNLKGHIIRMIELKVRRSGDYLLVWDMLNNQGEKVPAGQYVFVVMHAGVLQDKVLMFAW